MPEDRAPVGARSVPEAVAWWAERTPDALALLPPDEQAPPVTYRTLQRRIVEVADRLAAFGVGRDVPVAFQPDGRVEAAVTLLAAMRAGVAALLAPGASESELAVILERLAPGIVLVAESTSPLARAAQRVSAPVLSLADLLRPKRGVSRQAPEERRVAADDVGRDSSSLGTTPDGRDVESSGRRAFQRTRDA
jgi:acyl-coenzyme A synthetase/AMP-(fatty) acid ligase